MDLAKIRKKLKEQAAAKPPAEVPVVKEEKRPPDVVDAEAGGAGEAALNEAAQEAVSNEIFSIPIEAQAEAPAPVEAVETHVEALVEALEVAESDVSLAGGAAGIAEIEPENIVELLIFKISQEDYAFRVSDVHEIIKPFGITSVPGLDPFIVGITSLRGKIIPVVDLKKKLLLSGSGADKKNSKVLILKGPKGPIGALVDKGIDVIRLPEGEIVGPPSHLTEEELRYIEGVAPYNGRFYSIVRALGALEFNIKDMTERRAHERKT